MIIRGKLIFCTGIRSGFLPVVWRKNWPQNHSMRTSCSTDRKYIHTKWILNATDPWYNWTNLVCRPYQRNWNTINFHQWLLSSCHRGLNCCQAKSKGLFARGSYENSSECCACHNCSRDGHRFLHRTRAYGIRTLSMHSNTDGILCVFQPAECLRRK